MKKKISILMLAFLIPIFSTNILYAEEIRLMSYYPVPVGNYEIIRSGRLDASGIGNFLTIRNNDGNTEHWLFSSSNDDVVLSHSESTYDLLIEDTTGYIGIGTNDPSCNLHIKDVTETTDDFVGIRLESQKGNEEGIYFHFTEGGLGQDVGWILSRYNYGSSRHEMIIGNDPGYNTQLDITSNLINIGSTGSDIYFPGTSVPAELDPFGLYYEDGIWHLPIHTHLPPPIPSSRELKKDITPFSEKEYQDMLAKFNDLEIVRFRYKTDPEESKLRIGVIAEDSPDEITTEDKKALDNVSTIGFILAVLKAQNEEIKMLKEEIEKLEKKELSKLR